MRSKGAIGIANGLVEIRFPYDKELVDTVRSISGRKWNPDNKTWTTPIESAHEVAEKLANFDFSEDFAAVLLIIPQTVEEAAESQDIPIPAPRGLQYHMYQLEGIRYALQRDHTLLADEMGLGKTVEAIGFINAIDAQQILVVCPATVKLNWRNEFRRWLVKPLAIEVIDSNKTPQADGNVYITNYESIVKFQDELSTRDWDVVVVDEAHYCKNRKTQRSQAVFKLRATHKLMLTGTPILNRPIELYPLICYLGMRMKFWTFAKKYCAASQGRYGWDMSGASNLTELREILEKEIMVRRLKQDVLPELPQKVRQVIALNGNRPEIQEEMELIQRIRYERERLEKEKATAQNEQDFDFEKAAKRLNDLSNLAFTEIAKARHKTALAKVPDVIQFAEDVLENEGKVVVFAHHLDVLDQIYKGLQKYGAVKLVGDTKQEDRQAMIDRFQQDTGTRVFVGSIKAAGLGITLTAACTAIFAELDWTPATLSQAEDRLHRIGQNGSVLCQYLVFDGSIDARLAKVVVDKQEVITQLLESI